MVHLHVSVHLLMEILPRFLSIPTLELSHLLSTQFQYIINEVSPHEATRGWIEYWYGL